ncbi:initiator RepB protein [Fusobacterium periodonticum ATCC 33693]|uniref:Initiator RepB protein n=2 Tax=Fusobacterium periodonticum TaxID=860 RepID=D4CRM3_9FUSO|nr:initiator RepB protein [Fusobacterium periodonticum ATCC 33693]
MRFFGADRMNEIVKYHNDLSNQIIIKTLNANELNFFMAICSKMRDKETEEIVFTFKNLKELVKWTSNDNKDFIKSLENTNRKLIALNFRFEDEIEIVQFVLFPTFTINKDMKTLTVAVNKKFAFLLNNLSSNFTRFELENFTILQSKYSKYLYKELMKFKSTGYMIMSIEEFRNKLDIPIKYRMSEINKFVLKPIEQEIPNVLKGFKIDKIKKGKSIEKIEFCFTPIKKETLKNEIIEVEEEKVIDSVNENINPAFQLEKYFKTTFPDVNYTVKHRKVLENLLKNNSLEYIKQYLKDQWEYVQNDNNIKNKPAYFSKLILEEKAVLKDYLPADYEEKKAEENNRNTKGITSLKEFVKDITDYEVRKNITPEQIEQQVLLKVDVTEEEYNKIKQDWIDKQKEETSNSDMELLKTIFSASQSQKYNIIPAEKEETKLNLKYTKEVYEGKIKKTEYQIEFYKKELFKIMEDDDLELEELEEKRKYIEDKIENYKIKIENYKKEILKLKEEKN